MDTNIPFNELLKRKISLRLLGYYKYDVHRYKKLCYKHGLTEAVEHGFFKSIECILCLRELTDRIDFKDG
jgi:hypothetical protein